MNLIKISIYFFVTYFQTGYGSKIECRKSFPESQLSRLKKELLCDYDSTTRPQTPHGNRTTVNIFLALRHVVLDEEYDIISVHFGLAMTWNDERLRWDPSLFENIKQVFFESSYIWMPQVGWVTMNIVTDRLYSNNIPCLVNYFGKVICISWSSFHTICKSDLTHWPYDSHVCEALLAPWRLPQAELELISENNDTMIFQMYQSNKEWALLRADVKKRREFSKNSTFDYLELAFTIGRHSATYEATVVIPALVLALLNLASSWIEAESATRLNLVGSLLICHILYLQHMSLRLYKNGDNCPLIVLFYRNSLVMCGFSLLGIFLVRWMSTNTREPPCWLSGVMIRIRKSRTGQILLFIQEPRKVAESDGLEEAPQVPEQNWHLVGRLLDRISFFTFSVIYFIFLIMYYFYYL